MVSVRPRDARSLVENGRTEDLNRNTEEQAFSGREARARQVAAHLSKCVQSGQTPIRRCAPLVARVDSTWCRARRIAVRSCRVERIHGAHQNLERIACKRFFGAINR